MSDPLNKSFEPTRAAGLQRVCSFIKRSGQYYAENRNYDLGPKNRLNVSELSPYLRLRLITEKEVVTTVLSEHPLNEAKKFIEEICWRTYWKGWLEHRPKIWNKYLQELSELKIEIKKNSDLHNRYQKAIEGKTNIDAFDFWVQELISLGYLHNHARMWFASIWIFTLRLPWILGADFFFQHLLDGDPASNTLSWRWVAGLHTKGKCYIAKADNIFHFTAGRFNPKNQLTEQPHTLLSFDDPFSGVEAPIDLDIWTYKFLSSKSKNILLLITEEDLAPEYWDLSNFAVKAVIALPPNRDAPLVSEKVFLFREAAIKEALQRAHKLFSCPTFYINSPAQENIISLCETFKVSKILTPYVSVGPMRYQIDALRRATSSLKIEISEFPNEWDKTFWTYTKSGYFKLKERIPDLLSRFIDN